MEKSTSSSSGENLCHPAARHGLTCLRARSSTVYYNRLVPTGLTHVGLSTERDSHPRQSGLGLEMGRDTPDAPAEGGRRSQSHGAKARRGSRAEASLN